MLCILVILGVTGAWRGGIKQHREGKWSVKALGASDTTVASIDEIM